MFFFLIIKWCPEIVNSDWPIATFQGPKFPDNHSKLITHGNPYAANYFDRYSLIINIINIILIFKNQILIYIIIFTNN